MGVLSFTPYKGIKSELSPKLLPEEYAVEATNVFLDAGNLDAWNSLTEDSVLGIATGDINSLYLLNNSTWLHSNETLFYALAPIANNDKHYTVITGYSDGIVRYTDKNLATAGAGTAYPNFTYALGFPVPSTTLLATVSLNTAVGIQFQWDISGTETDAIGNKLTYSYVYTYADADGREGAPSHPSDLVNASTDNQITLTNFTSLAGNYNPVGAVVRIYRSQSGSPFQFLAELPDPPVGNQFVDDFTLTSGDPIETALWSAPPNGLQGIVTMANGMMAGYLGNDLYISEPFQPHAYPEDYIRHTDYPILGLAAAGNTLIISTEKYPYIGVGNHPSIFTLNKLETIQANVNLSSLIDIGDGAMYASEDGIVMMTSAGASVVTKDIIAENTWRAMNPSSIHAVFYREKYFGFYNAGSGLITTDNGETIPAKGSFLFDQEKGFVTYSDEYANAAYSDLNSAELYLAQLDGVNKVFKWNSGATKLAKSWTSVPRILVPTTFTAGRVEWKSGTVVIKVYADKILRHTETVSNSKIFRMPSGYQAKEWYINITGSGVIDAVFLSTSGSELV